LSETPAVVYLEADDEITSVVRRVRESDAERVLVVVPGRSRATSSAVALRLLTRAGEDSGREVAVVGDALTRSLAVEAGLAAYATLGDARDATAPAVDDRTEVRHAAIHVVRGTDETVATPTVAVEDATRPVPVARPSTAPRRSRRRRLIAAVAAILALLAVVGLAGAVVLPSATITIQPATETVGPVPLVIELEDPERLNGTAEASATVTATGSYEILEPATGTVVLLNWSAFDQPIAAGTLVAAGRQAFETQADVLVQRGSLTAEGTIQAGEATVGVTASAPGPAGNVPAGAIDTILTQDADARLQGGFPENNQRRVVNRAATSGGVDESGIRITRADVEATVEALNADLRQRVGNEIEQIVDAIVVQPELAEPDITGLDDLAGTRDQPEATIRGSLTWEAFSADRDEVMDLARGQFADDPSAVPEGQVLLPESIDIAITEAIADGEALRVDITATGLSAPLVDPGTVAERVTGLTADEAEAELADIGDASVELWPDWVASVPTVEWRIDVRVVEP
jgi:hypothetical protein